MDWATGVFNGDRESHWVSKPFSLIDYCCSKCIIYEHLLVPKTAWPSRPYPLAYVITLFTELKMNGGMQRKVTRIALVNIATPIYSTQERQSGYTLWRCTKLCGRVRILDTIGYK
jgi:hypothetical protein